LRKLKKLNTSTAKKAADIPLSEPVNKAEAKAKFGELGKKAGSGPYVQPGKRCSFLTVNDTERKLTILLNINPAIRTYTKPFLITCFC